MPAASENKKPTAATVAPHYYLGFDCATKTLAYGLVRVDAAGYAARRDAIRAELTAIRANMNGAGAAARLKALDAEVSGFLQILRGDVVDLFPGRADASIHTVERIRALATYVNGVVRPAVVAAGAGANLTVLVEYQMGPNARARVIAAALVALFHDADVRIVGPSLKNRVGVIPSGRYCYFVEKYKSKYTANKAHTIFNFAQLEKTFGTRIPATKLSRGHLADAVMQIFGYIVHGSDVEAF